MSLKFSKHISSPIEIEVQKLLTEYQEALKADAEFHVLKTIRDRIKLLENTSKERQKQPNRNTQEHN